MNPQLSKVLERLKGVIKSGNGYKALCPAHDDHKPSLSISEGDDGRVLICCHAGCECMDILAVIDLSMKDLMPDTNGVYISTTKAGNGKYYKTAKEAIASTCSYLGEYSQYWTYYDEGLEPVAVVLRWDTKTGKEFRPVSKTNKGWVCKAMQTPRCLYQLPTVKESNTVYVVEGEKAADSLARTGLPATTSQGGSKAASKTDWTPLAGKTVVILPDNDDAGERYASDVVGQLAQLTPSPTVKVVRLPELPDKGDAFEFVARFGDDQEACKSALQEAVDAANREPLDSVPEKKRKQTVESKPVITWLEDVEIERVTWLWNNRIPLCKLTSVSGDPCLGKSTLTMGIAATVSSGAPWVDSPSVKREPCGVVILSAEDGLADTIKPRLEAAGANMKNIISLDAVTRSCDDTETEAQFSLVMDIPQLRKAIQMVPNCRLVIIDPIAAYLGGTDSHKDAQVRGVLAPLAKLAEDMGVAIILVSHHNKSNGKKAIYRQGGSIAFVAAVRAAFAVVKDTKDPERRLFLPTKTNLAPSDIGGLAYYIESKTIQTSDGETTAPFARIDPEPVDSCADDYMGEPNDDTDDQDDAAVWLRDTLAGGAVNATELFYMASQQGFTKKMMRTARKGIGAVTKKSGFGGGWVWELPSNG